ncbi:CpsD/CapB family tyrosine-protein kinase [Thermovenabulum sp.]|uniref:CpsD/CapB family tyrosine-protein kinase n=1 Tax=Thermovenabulum sp. TaxID=3100335 RepID=UPI003C7B0302
MNMNMKLLDDIYVLDDPKSVVSEAFRVFRTNLQFASIDKPLKKILITSSVPREGKSSVAANLAVTLASAEKSVLLIDADLRRPKQNKIFYIENHIGLSNFLAENIELDSVIQSTVIQNLYILPSGPVPPNPAEVLSSKKMKNFLEEVSQNYDYLIIDSPPVNSVADASILSTLVDGVILVTACHETEREALIVAKNQLEKVNARILGVVLNKVKENSGSYYYYYYYYGEDSHKIRKKRKNY